MKRILLTALAAAVAVSAATAQAAVPPLEELFNGSEVRRNVSFGWERRSDVIRLLPDGSVTGNFEVSRKVSRGRSFRYSGTVRGRWTVENGRLCLEGEGLRYRGPNCYAISKGKYSANEYSGLDTRTGDVWEIFVYPLS